MRKNIRCAVSGLMGAVMFIAAVFPLAPMTAEAAPEIVAGGYEIDMEKIPQVHFSEHKDWETLYQTAWDSHKSNITAITKELNGELTTDEEQSYYVDEAFDDRIFQWDTLFMMLFDKYGLHEFPTLNSMDNFYYQQYDTDDESDGFICRMIYQETGEHYYKNYMDVDAVNPPMFAWAEWEQYKIHGDVERFTKVIKGKTILERLDSYYQFIKRTRTYTSGPAEGLYVSNGQSSGLDNTPNQNWNGWGQAVNDMSLQQVQAAGYISRIANEVLEKKENLTEEERAEYEALREKYENEEAELKSLIQQKLWSEEGGFFFNMDSNTGELTNIATPTGLWALAAGVATQEQADCMIEEYALNSNKMFRPNGLATVCYDYETFKSTGGYWNGAMWSPASYQWLKGLQQYGYDDLAFEEAVRHVNAMADVCVNGAYDRYGSFLYTLWENYSTEYSIPGSTEFSDTQPARSNFVGWAGALGIGAVLEDIMGITIDGTENVVNWNIKLTEAFGVENLYFNGAEGENFVSLSCGERISDTSGAKITVKADHDFELRVKVAGREEVIQAKAGEHSYSIAGTDGEESYLGIRTTKLAEASFSAEKLEEADSAVIFAEQGTSGETDGLPHQVEKGNEKIFNVNTVGFYRTNSDYTTELKDSSVMQDLGVENAKEYVKTTSPYGAEGFMFMVPASNQMQTAKVLVGVKNGTAKVEADVLDASEVTKIAELKGEEEETVYAVEIPVCASRDTELMVTVTMEQNGTEQGEISLKAVLLEDGGAQVPDAPVQIKAEPEDLGLTVSASAPEGTAYDSYRVYYKKSGENSYQVKETKSLPCVLENLENYKRYEVFVTGVKNGAESSDSVSVSQIPEKVKQSDARRAYSDWQKVQEQVLNGNVDFAHVESALNFHVTDTVYGTEFSFSSDSNSYRYGLRNDGSVANPIKPLEDMASVLTVKAVCGEETVTITVPIIVTAREKEEGDEEPGTADTQVQIAQYAQPEKVNLTEEGSSDWKLFNSVNLEQIEGKADGQGIENIAAIQEVTKMNEDPSDVEFAYVDGTQAASGKYDKGIVFEKAGNGIQLDLPGGSGRQEVKIYLGAWSAKVKIAASIVKDGQAVREYTEYFDTGVQASEAPAEYEVVSIGWQLEDADAVLHIKISNETLYDETWGNMNLGAITLKSSFQVNAEKTENGTIIITNPIAAAGEKVTVFAVPDEGYQLAEGSLRYYMSGTQKGSAIEGESFLMPNGNVTVKAEFKEPEKPGVDPAPQQPSGNQPVVQQKPSANLPVVQEKPTENQTVKLGQTYESGNYSYKVTDVNKQTVEVVGITKDKLGKLKKITIYNVVTLGGKSYQVTSIGASAFKGNKKATSAVIGKNVKTIGNHAFAGCKLLKKVTVKSTKLTQIGKKAFSGCGKLKNIVIKSKMLKKVGKNAFKGIYKKAVIKVPAAKYKAYAKLLAKKEQSKTVKIKK